MIVACCSRLRAEDRGLPVGLGRLDDRRLKLLFPAGGLLRLDEHFLLLADLVDADFLLGDLLPGDGGGQRAGLLGSACLACTVASNSACFDSLSRRDCAMATSASYRLVLPS